MNNTFKNDIAKIVRSAMNESFSSWCDANIEKFDLVGFASHMVEFFKIFNKLYEMDEVYNFKFLLYDENLHKELIFQYPESGSIVDPEKLAQYFSDLIKNKMAELPDELAKYMKNTYMCIEINPNRYLYNYMMSYVDLSSNQKIYIDDDREYSCVIKSFESGKVLLYITTTNFMKSPETYIEFFS